MMRQTRTLVVAVCAAAALAQGCGEAEDAATETVTGELGSFGSWGSMGGLLLDSPAVVKGPATTYTAFGWGTDSQIWTTAQDASGRWTGAWTPLPGGAFSSRPAAAALNLASGPLANQFAIAALRSDGHYYIRIQNQSGSNVVQDWVQVVDPHPPVKIAGEPWVSAPALAFVHRTTEDALVIAGKQQNRLIWALAARVDAVSGNWNRDGWIDPATTLPMYADTTPALASLYTTSTNQDDILLAAGDQGPSGITFKYLAISGQFICSCYGGGWGWSPWYTLTTGLFSSGPAIAGAKTAIGAREWTIYGLGTDQRVYVTNRLANDGQFSPIGSNILGGTPSAMGSGNNVSVTALSGAVPVINSAKSPF